MYSCCFSRSLNKASARSIPELSWNSRLASQAYLKVSRWCGRQTIAARWNTSIILSRFFSFELSLSGGRPVLRAKDAMAREERRLQFTGVLLPKVPAAEPISFLFFVPAVHPVNTLRAVIEADKQRLRLQRSTRFPLSLQACYDWWLSFLAEAMCPVCRKSRVELAGIIISQQKSKGDEIKQANKTKAGRCETLLQELETHVRAEHNKASLLFRSTTVVL